VINVCFDVSQSGSDTDVDVTRYPSSERFFVQTAFARGLVGSVTGCSRGPAARQGEGYESVLCLPAGKACTTIDIYSIVCSCVWDAISNHQGTKEDLECETCKADSQLGLNKGHVEELTMAVRTCLTGSTPQHHFPAGASLARDQQSETKRNIGHEGVHDAHPHTTSQPRIK
jgi:hypothetical protein